MCWIVALAVVGVLAFMTWASAYVGSGVYLPMLCRRRGAKGVVALTFDDGPDAERTPRVLDVLRKYDARATFFVIGRKVEEHPEIVARIVAEGHTVASHTYYHTPAWTMWREKRVTEELTKASDAVERVVGRRPLLFRPPVGITNPVIGRAVRKLGLTAVGWSVRSLDTIARHERVEVAQRVLRKVKSGDVVLLHDRCERADELLEMVLSELSRRGLRSVSVDEMFEIKAYEN